MKRNGLFFCLLILLFISMQYNIISTAYAYPLKEYEVYKYEDEVPHFFCHQLIHNSKEAFASNNNLRWHFYRDCATATEFHNFLAEMEKNNYVLIDIFDVYGVSSDGAYRKDVYVPLGKKPFLLSLDDMSFDAIGKGLSDKIVLTEEGEIGSYSINNNKKIEFDKESIPILEQFIKENPHFSFNNARMTICPTGYNGILGYRITHKNKKVREQEIENIKPLVTRLKQLKYRFASHTYNHINCAYSSNNDLYKDLKKYEDNIISVIGETPILSFPEGAWQNNNNLNIMNNFGYNIFLCVGMPCEFKQIEKNIFIRRYCLDNSAFSSYKYNFDRYINIGSIRDSSRDII